MAGGYSKKRKVEDGMKGKTKRPTKKFKKQTDYHSSDSEDEVSPSTPQADFQAVNLQDSDDEGLDKEDLITGEVSDQDDEPIVEQLAEEEITDASNSDSDSAASDNSNPNLTRKRKRNDPEAFATSMSKILGAKLATSKRADPVLSRSQAAIETSKEITDQALEKKAKNKMKDDKRAALEKGRVKDVLGASTAFDAANGTADLGQSSVQEVMEMEKRLRKTAQRGVVKLFNAVRAAQVKGEEAAREARVKGLVGVGRREEKVNEMSKKGFLDLIAGGGGGLKAGSVEEALNRHRNLRMHLELVSLAEEKGRGGLRYLPFRYHPIFISPINSIALQTYSFPGAGGLTCSCFTAFVAENPRLPTGTTARLCHEFLNALLPLEADCEVWIEDRDDILRTAV
ncbi:putative Ribosomal RNA-processing protein 15 [Glarea lozoyensis 74030]|uniref:Putative Ribosomal RNA-processing protein 15 n=1 Tax=Glarea lozoyensis (strain ATCC 74030 / MF5533) TaxID=1104152 RepID=H0EZ96_GLAL7|nr:putative Ribosomal RNA-processing protein 15 [Glarea lozoyensis 74030]